MAAVLQCLTSCLTCLKGVKATPIKRAPPSVVQQSNAPPGVPEYVIKYAPLVYMDPTEKYMPADLATHLAHCTPMGNNRAALANLPSPLTLDNLDLLNAFSSDKGKSVYLTSNDDFTKNPPWILGTTPDANGKTENAISSVVIVADKGNGLVDAFYFYFNSFDDGGIVLDQNLGNHVGDWEHNMVRFQNGVPQAIWFSQHSGGQSFTYKAVQKDAAGLRPIDFSANGSHANYGLAGDHDHTIATIIPGLNLPGDGLITDHTGYGALWDPIKSAYWYSYTGPTGSTKDSSPTRFDSQVGTFTAYDNATSPVGWLYFQGRWGDQQLPDSDPRQKSFFGQYKYTTGPNGPAYKNLVRKNVWPGGTGVLSPVLVP
ncbi:hypothetical protein, variant [Verruconis gallopava]|nr:hypothetical protein, variant [Verruconis gallopava]KIW07489.1 hypothetical protein, variant [Verruconis gallopava]